MNASLARSTHTYQPSIDMREYTGIEAHVHVSKPRVNRHEAHSNESRHSHVTVYGGICECACSALNRHLSSHISMRLCRASIDIH